HHVAAAAVQSPAHRSGTGQDDGVPAAVLHLPAGIVPGGLRDLLDLEQHHGHPAAVGVDSWRPQSGPRGLIQHCELAYSAARRIVSGPRMSDALPNPPFAAAALDAGQRLFRRPCTFLRGVLELAEMPDAALPEVALAGRSNVGKSSLLNALTGH